jgi:intraflagellar transport protein 140
MEAALSFYEKAADTLSLVRVQCYCEKYDVAAKIASDTGDKAACYHLARQLENTDNLTQAIHFFSKAQAYGNAIRLCKVSYFYHQL